VQDSRKRVAAVQRARQVPVHYNAQREARLVLEGSIRGLALVLHYGRRASSSQLVVLTAAQQLPLEMRSLWLDAALQSVLWAVVLARELQLCAARSRPGAALEAHTQWA